MRSLIRILQVSVLLAFVLALTCAPIHAVTRVKSASGYGPNVGSAGGPTDSSGVMRCASGMILPNCEAYYILGLTTLDGLSATEYQFSDTGSGDANVIFDVFDLGTGAISSSLSLSGSILSVFACGDSFTSPGTPSTFAYDSSQTNLTNPPGGGPGLSCSPIEAGGTGSTTDALGNPFDFTLNTDGSITFGNTSGDDVVVFAEPATATPEPATFTLMGFGLAALAGLLVRRSA
jgi:hypothetical protein